MAACSASILLSQLNSLKNVIKSPNHYKLISFLPSSFYTTEAKANLEIQDAPKKKMSKAMLSYLQRAKEYDEFMKKEKTEFEIGRRHLANMMGENPEHFSQKQIDDAIKYLFPSGLFDPQARPIMKPPEEVYPERKAAQFDETGRPFNSFFYTKKPNYYHLLYDIVEKIQELNKIEDNFLLKGVAPNPDNKVDMFGTEVLKLEELEKLLLEALTAEQYEYFVSTITALTEHPYSYLVKDFVDKYRKKVIALSADVELLKIQNTEDGRPYVEVLDCMRKSSRGRVKLIGNGTGIIKINGKDITYFHGIQEREQIIFPLVFTDMLNKVDIQAIVQFGGPTGQAGALRWGISWALRNFVPPEMIEKMRVAGLLTRDWRRRERKKPGQEGARRKFQWNKR